MRRLYHFSCYYVFLVKGVYLNLDPCINVNNRKKLAVAQTKHERCVNTTNIERYFDICQKKNNTGITAALGVPNANK